MDFTVVDTVFFQTGRYSRRAVNGFQLLICSLMMLLPLSKLGANRLNHKVLQPELRANLSPRDTGKVDTMKLGLGMPNLGPVYFMFESHEQALDSLLLALMSKKGMPPHAFLNAAQFTQQWKLHDTGASQQVIDGFWLTYQYKFSKSFLKTRKWLTKNKISLKRSSISSKPKIIESSDGSGITKYEYKVTYKDEKYIFWFQLWWIEEKAYWVNEIGFRLAPL